MLMAKDNINKSKINIPAIPENIVHQIPGSTTVRHTQLEKIPGGCKRKLLAQLRTRLSALKQLHPKMNFTFAHNFATAIFIGKLNYAA